MINESRFKQLKEKGLSRKDLYKPDFFRLSNEVDKERFAGIITSSEIILCDEIYGQLKELIKTRNPRINFRADEYPKLIDEHLNGCSPEDYGVWVYYPWGQRIVHILDEKEFVELRTSRNKYKITEAEQNILAQKRVGIIGLSVGQSVSLTMAMERTAGELRIADFDDLEITNLNRLRSGLHNMGLLKTVLVAREIAEIDPFLKVTCYHKGINDENMESFLLDNGKLDILIDECDGVDIKINCRVAAKKHHIPVVMEASDRGTIDIERFDLEPDRPILHGYVEHLDISKLKGLKTNEEKLPYILPIAGIETMSTRMKASAVEVGQTISTWPQLASAVAMGGGITTDICRRILLDQLHQSGRYFIDIEELISDPKEEEQPIVLPIIEPLTINHMEAMAAKVSFKAAEEAGLVNDKSIIEALVKAALIAPSAGNMQPWKWYFDGKSLFLFHDEERTASFSDFRGMVSYLSLGTAIEHIYLKASQLKLSVNPVLFPSGEGNKNNLIAGFRFYKNEDIKEDLLAEYFTYRHTNRNLGKGKKIGHEIFEDLNHSVAQVNGAVVRITDDNELLKKVAIIAGKADKLRIFIEDGHFDLFNRELKFSNEAPENIKEGLDVRSLDLTAKDQVGFRVIKDLKAIRLINEWNGGSALESVSRDQISSAAAVGILTMPSFNAENILNAGRAIERVWLTATSHSVAFQPLLASVLHFARIMYGKGEGIPDKIRKEFILLHDEFVQIFGISDSKEAPLFLFRLCYAEAPKLIAQRLDIEDVYFVKKS